MVTADGALVQKAQALQFTVPGLKHPFVLSGGAQGETLRKREDLLGKEIRVTGKLPVKNTGQPPELTVESFQPKDKQNSVRPGKNAIVPRLR